MNWVSKAETLAGGNGLGSALNQLHFPYGLYIDDIDQNNPIVYIADSYNHRILTSNGQIGIHSNGYGNRFDQLHCPTDILIDKKTNSFIISDRGNRRVIRWSCSNVNQGEILVDQIDCWGIAMDKNGDLYVVDSENHRVQRYHRGETDGTIVAGGNGKGDNLNQLHDPHYIFVDDALSMYISDHKNNRVIKWEKNAREGVNIVSKRLFNNIFTRMNGPEGIFVDSTGAVFVADSNNHRIVRYDSIGLEWVVIVGGKGPGTKSNQLYQPTGLSCDQRGNLYVIDWRNHRLQRFSVKSD